MSTPTTEARGQAGTTALRARFTDLLAAERIKLRSLRSTYWVLGGGALVVIAINANSACSNARRLAGMPQPPAGTERHFRFDPLHAAFVEPAWQLWMVIAATVGALCVFGEYTSGLVRTTFTAVPDRRAVIAAKTAVVAAVLCVLGVIVAGVSFGVTQALLREEGGLSVGDPGAVRAIAASALLAPVCALVGMALGAAIRHAAGTVVAVVGTLLLLPAVLQGDTYRWVKEIGNAMLLSAWRRLVENPSVPGLAEKYPVTPAEAWTVFAVWPLVAVAVTVTVVCRRDV
ncbi:ABC transporter permease [Streptomyces sp. NPDC015345]|uniref:ABC transporter permease n=1 Tax=Streptomyces sp. NPDC015345 TaxID=3364953 RepID=UPI0036FFF87E